MNLSLFKNHCGKTQWKCKGEVYCDIHEPAALSAATPPEWHFLICYFFFKDILR